MSQPHDNEIARRLLLAKDFFARGSEYSSRAAPIDRIAAIHHFHVSIEITVKAVLTHFEIRADRELNIDFETMLSQIDQNKDLISSGKKLRYRQDLRNLNQARNLAQHHAHPPEYESLEHWQKICQRFLESAFETFFEIDFWSLSRISYIQDHVLRELLELTSSKINDGIVSDAVYPLSVAFELAGRCLSKLAPNERVRLPFFAESRRGVPNPTRDISKAIQQIYERIAETDRHVGMVGSGIALKDLKRLNRSIPNVWFSGSGNPAFRNTPTDAHDPDEVRWALTCVTNCILLWQDRGLEPTATTKDLPDLKSFLVEQSGQSSK